MSKLSEYLQKQLETEYKKEAEDCLKIYNALLEINNGSVWRSQWQVLTTFNGHMHTSTGHLLTYKPSSIGYIFLKGLKES